MKFSKLPLIAIFLCLASIAFNANAVTSPDQLIIERVECIGNVTVPAEMITSELYLSAGEKVNQEEIENARVRIALLGLFKDVSLYLKKGSERGKVVLVIKVEEDSQYFTSFQTGNIVNDSRSIQQFFGQVGTRNLFNTNKTLQFGLRYGENLNSYFLQNFNPTLDYIDPHFLGSKKYFFSLGLSYQATIREYYYNGVTKEKTLGGKLALGRRFGDFSYVSVGYRQKFFELASFDQQGGWSSDFAYRPNVYFINYGWNSENDPVFQTDGSRFMLGGALPEYSNGVISSFYLDINYKTTWTVGEKSSLTFNFGGVDRNDEGHWLYSGDERSDLLFGLNYNYDWKKNRWNDEVETGRYYFGVGFDELVKKPGVKIGTTINTKSFGLLNFFFIYKQEVR